MIPNNQAQILIDEAIYGLEDLARITDFLKFCSETLLSSETLDNKGVERLKVALEFYFQNFDATSEMIGDDLKYLFQMSKTPDYPNQSRVNP